MFLEHVIDLCEDFAQMSSECRAQIKDAVSSKKLKVLLSQGDIVDFVLPFFERVRGEAENFDDYGLKRETNKVIRKFENWLDEHYVDEDDDLPEEPPMHEVSWDDFCSRCPVWKESLDYVKKADSREYEFVLAMEGPKMFDVWFRLKASTSHLMDLRLTLREVENEWTIELYDRNLASSASAT